MYDPYEAMARSAAVVQERWERRRQAVFDELRGSALGEEFAEMCAVSANTEWEPSANPFAWPGGGAVEVLWEQCSYRCSGPYKHGLDILRSNEDGSVCGVIVYGLAGLLKKIEEEEGSLGTTQ